MTAKPTPSPKEYAEALRVQQAGRRRRAWLVGGAIATVVVAVGVLVWLFLFSSAFTARETIVEGHRILTADDYREAAAVPYGRPLARVDLGAVEQRIRSLPEVRDVTVERDFPDAVRVTVTERMAVFQLRVGDSYSWVDEGGVVFRGGEPLAPDMPVAEVDDPDERMLRDIGVVVEHLPENVLDEVELLEAGSVDMIEVELAGERRVVWGSADESQLKSEVLAALLGVDAEVYDVSAPNHPTTR